MGAVTAGSGARRNAGATRRNGAAAIQPEVTQTPEERHALVCSVNQYAVCAARSGDPRVQQLKAELEERIKPRLRVVASR